MEEKKPQSDGQLKMEKLCRQLKTFQEQRDEARRAEIGSRINISLLEPTIKQVNNYISELMKSGITRFVVPDKEIETPAQQQIKPQVS